MTLLWHTPIGYHRTQKAWMHTSSATFPAGLPGWTETELSFRLGGHHCCNRYLSSSSWPVVLQGLRSGKTSPLFMHGVTFSFLVSPKHSLLYHQIDY